MKISALPVMLAFAIAAFGTTSYSQSAKTQQSTAHQDTEFVKKAAQGSVNEIDLAQIALKKSNDDEVKDFAQKMITDHNSLIEDMKPFAEEAGLERPEHPDAATEALKLKLDVLSGKSFDKAYIKAMVEDHHKDLEAFMKESHATGYPALREAVEKGEKVVHEHLEMIDGIAKKNGVAPAPAPAV
jgi:putative membrane protein